MKQERFVYLDSAATSYPKPKSVINAVANAMINHGGNPGRSGHKLAMEASRCVYECRESVAGLFSCPHPENIVFTCNATYALNMAIKGLCKKHSHIVFSNLEHNSVMRPVYSLCADKENCMDYSVFDGLGSDEDILNSFKGVLRRDTSLAVVTLASNVCGKIMPVQKLSQICKENGITLVVDASQAAGHLEINFQSIGADVLCAPGHKGLYGPMGTGFCIFGEGLKLRSLIQGGSGVNSMDMFMPELLPERLEAGTLNVPALYGLTAGIEYVKSIGLQDIRDKTNELCSTLTQGLHNCKGVTLYTDGYAHVPCVCFNKEGLKSERVASELSQSNICVRAGLHCAPLAHKALCTGEQGALRASLSHTNTKKDIDSLLYVLNKL